MNTTNFEGEAHSSSSSKGEEQGKEGGEQEVKESVRCV